jgi:hypothetical protein
MVSIRTGATAEGADALIDRGRQILGRVDPMAQHQEDADINHDARQHPDVVDQLRPVPLQGAKTDAHGLISSIACGGSASGGGRRTSAIVRPSATAKAMTGLSAR